VVINPAGGKETKPGGSHTSEGLLPNCYNLVMWTQAVGCALSSSLGDGSVTRLSADKGCSEGWAAKQHTA
jgi:hypothetical protein